jgi:hypothetical protein
MSTDRSNSPTQLAVSVEPPAALLDERALLARALDAVINVAGKVPGEVDKLVPALKAMIAEAGGLYPGWEESLRKLAPLTARMHPPGELPEELKAAYWPLARPAFNAASFHNFLTSTAEFAAASDSPPESPPPAVDGLAGSEQSARPIATLSSADAPQVWLDLSGWEQALCHDVAGAQAVLSRLRGRAPTTWKAGHAILKPIFSVSAELLAAISGQSNPENPTAAARARLAAVSKFDAVSLLDDLAAAMTADCDAQRGRTAGGEMQQPTSALAREPGGQTATAADPAGRRKGKGKRGRPRSKFTSEDERLLVDYEASDLGEKGFARARGLNYKDVRASLKRARFHRAPNSSAKR